MKMSRRWIAVVAAGAVVASGFADIRSSEVTFQGQGGVELRGTFLVPAKSEGKRPGVLLLPGSGPTDRDGNQPPGFVTNVLKGIAERLGDEGVVTLRFDKRAAHGYAEAWPKDEKALGEFFSYENFVTDASEAYRFLRANERVDPKRVVILGHSEGGLFALQIAADLRAKKERPAGLILLGTAGRVLDEVLTEQIKALLHVQTADQTVRDLYTGHLEKCIRAVKKGEELPADVPIGLRPIFNPSVVKLLRAYFTVDPAQLAADVRGPVLVLQGARDAQISAERDAPRLVEALKGRAGADGSRVDLVILPEVSHNLKRVPPEASGAGAAGIAGPVAPEALERIGAWCREHLGERPE